MSILELQKKIVSEFAAFPSWEERYKHIMSLGQHLPPFPEEQRLDKNKVKGCQSQVWMHAELQNGKIIYHIDSDALIVKGLAAILHHIFNQQTPTEIIAAPIDFLSEIGLTQHLSQSRANGLAAMVKQFKTYAIVFIAMMQK